MPKLDEDGKFIREKLAKVQIQADTGNFLELARQFKSAVSLEQRCNVLRQVI